MKDLFFLFYYYYSFVSFEQKIVLLKQILYISIIEWNYI